VITHSSKQSSLLKPSQKTILRTVEGSLATLPLPSMISNSVEQSLYNRAYAKAYPQHLSVSSKGKRLLDVMGALVGLVITAILFIPIAIVIQLDNPGPILYSQIRCGVQGQTFRIWKFRSMVNNADALKKNLASQNQASGHIFKMKDDPRITRVGRILRKTSLDEFPQFLNVLLGEMSLVGTRPPSLDEVANYDRHHWQRLAVKPGITGEWQANGRSSVTDFEDIVQMDLDYQAKWSVLYDLQLLFKTVWVVFAKKGAC
jgi:lipopolysaccharide/colanic/teichoic acid biosynthesis glycosyltransferase